MKKLTAIYHRFIYKSTTAKKIESLSTFKKTTTGNLTTSSIYLKDLYKKLLVLNPGNSFNCLVKTPLNEKNLFTMEDDTLEKCYTTSNLWKFDELSIIAEIVNQVRKDITLMYVLNEKTNENCFYCVARSEFAPYGLNVKTSIEETITTEYKNLTGAKTSYEKTITKFVIEKISVPLDDITNLLHEIVNEKKFKKDQETKRKAKKDQAKKDQAKKENIA